jgi:V/A-type H+-transporting ATPase subunit I
MLETMAKLHIIGHQSKLDETLAVLHGLRSVHLIDVSDDGTVPLPPLAVDEQHLQRIEELRYLRARLGSVLALMPNLPEPGLSVPEMTESSLDRVRGELNELAPTVEQIVHHIDDLIREQETLPRHVASLTKLLPLVPGLAQLHGYGTAVLLVESRHSSVLGELHVQLTEKLAGNFEIISDHVDTNTVGAVLVYPRDHSEEVASLLGREAISRVRLPRQYETMSFREAISAMKTRLADLPGEIASSQRELDVLVAAHADWAAAASYLEQHLDQLGAIRHLGATAHTFVISSWVPERSADEIAKVVTERVGEKVIVERVAVEDGEVPPVLMHNPAPARPFEFLVRLLAIPRYGTVDPTLLMGLFVPLFFGIMLGDVIYGAILLALAVIASRYLRNRPSALRDLSRVFVLSASWAILWGIVYGEYLGDLGHRLLGIEPIWINREEALEPLLLFALAIGAGHVTLGLLLGVWQSLKFRRGHETLERLMLLLTLGALFTLAAVAADFLPRSLVTPSFAAIVVATVVLMVLGGGMGPVMAPLEIIGLVGNVLSYLRIAALGVASVYLARVANELGAAAPLWLGILIAALFHALNLALGAFSPTVQALRLHSVEFFSKFYDEGGDEFRPFGGLDNRVAST